MHSIAETQALIHDLELLRFQFLLKRDYESFKNICHPDLSYIHTSGKVDNFSGYIGKCLAGFYQYQKVDLNVNRINIIDNVAMLFADLKSEFLAGNEEKKLNNKILSIWIQEHGEWKFFAYQPTAIL